VSLKLPPDRLGELPPWMKILKEELSLRKVSALGIESRGWRWLRSSANNRAESPSAWRDFTSGSLKRPGTSFQVKDVDAVKISLCRH